MKPDAKKMSLGELLPPESKKLNVKYFFNRVEDCKEQACIDNKTDNKFYPSGHSNGVDKDIGYKIGYHNRTENSCKEDQPFSDIF